MMNDASLNKGKLGKGKKYFKNIDTSLVSNNSGSRILNKNISAPNLH